MIIHVRILIDNFILINFILASNDDNQSMLVLPIDDVDIYKKRDRLIVKVYYYYLKFDFGIVYLFHIALL